MALSTQVGFVQGHTLLTFQQTDGSATHGQSVACSGATLTGDTGNDFAIAPGGTAGVTPRTITVAGSATEAAMFFESGAVGYTKWDAGVWRIDLTISSATGDLRLREIYVCRVNSSGVSQGTVASSAFDYELGDTSTPALFSCFQENDVTAAATDRVYIVMVIQNTDGSPQGMSYTPSNKVYSPIKTVVHVRARRQRRRGALGMSATVSAVVNAPTVEVVKEVAPPTVVVNVGIPTQLKVSPPHMLRDLA